MKTPAPKTTSSALHPQKGSRPFFSKEGEGAFFSQDQVQLKAGQEHQSTSPFFGGPTKSIPFFTPSNIQAKLTIGQPGDKYEQEADAVADQVVQKLAEPTVQKADAPIANFIRPGGDGNQRSITNNQQPITSHARSSLQPQTDEALEKENLEREEALQPKPIFESNGDPDEENVQRKCAACAQEEEQGIAPKLRLKPLHFSPKPAGIQRKCAACQAEAIRPERIQMQGGKGTEQATSGLESRLNVTKGNGSPLPKDTRSSMESAFGADFSGVRVHTNNDSVQMNRELGAQAFTHGSDIYFNRGKYDTQSGSGQRLLAHELTHTIQQGSVGPSPKLQESCIQRKKTGAKVQDKLRTVNSELVTEVPVPGAAPRGELGAVSPVAFNVMGYADLYKAGGNIVPGIRGIAIDDIPSGPHMGKKKYVYANISSFDDTEGPHTPSPELSGGTGDYARFAVDGNNNSTHFSGHNAISGNFPAKIYLGEIKGMGTLMDNPLTGPKQLDDYQTGLKRFISSAKRDFGPHVQKPEVGELSGLAIPDGLDYDKFDQEHKRSGEGILIEGQDRVWLAEVGGTGVYLWARLPHPYRLTGDVDRLRRQAIERLREDILEEFNKIKQKKAGPKLSPKLLPEREREQKASLGGSQEEHEPNAHTIGEEAEKTERYNEISPIGKTIQRKTNWADARRKFNDSLKQWKQQHGNAFLNNDQVEKYLEPKAEFNKKLNRRESSTSPFKDDTKDFQKIDFWASSKGKAIGNLRILLGEKFDVLAEKIESLKGRTRAVKAKARGLAPRKFSVGWMSKVSSLLLKGFKVGFEELLEYSFEVFAECINAVIAKFEEEMRQQLVEGLVDEELEAKLTELKTELEILIAELQAKYEEQLTEYEYLLEVLQKGGEYYNMIAGTITAIRLGVQIVSCFTPPGLGCLWGIVANIGIEVALNLIVGTEWFEEEFMKPLVKDLMGDFLKDSLLKFLQGMFELVGLEDYVEGIEECTPKDLEGQVNTLRFYDPGQGSIIPKDQYEQHAKAWEAANREVLMSEIVAASGGTASSENIEKLLEAVKNQNLDSEAFKSIVEGAKTGENTFDFSKIAQQIPGINGESGEEGATVRTIDGEESPIDGEATGTTTVSIDVENISLDHLKGELQTLTLLVRHGDNAVRIFNVKVTVSNRYYYDTHSQSRVRERSSANYFEIVYKIAEPKGYSLPFPDRKLFFVFRSEFSDFLPLK